MRALHFGFACCILWGARCTEYALLSLCSALTRRALAVNSHALLGIGCTHLEIACSSVHTLRCLVVFFSASSLVALLVYARLIGARLLERCALLRMECTHLEGGCFSVGTLWHRGTCSSARAPNYTFWVVSRHEIYSF